MTHGGLQKTRREFFRETIIVFFMTGIAFLAALALRVLYTRSLSVAEYGLFYAVLAAFNMFMPFKSLGIANAAAYFFPKYADRPERVRSGSLFLGSVIMIGSVVITGLLWLIRKPLASTIYNAPIAADLIILVGLYFVGSSSREFLTALFQTRQRTIVYGSIDMVRQLTLLLASFAFLDYGILGVGLAWALTPLVDLCYWLYAIITERRFLSGTYVWNPRISKDMWLYGKQILFSTVGLVVIANTDSILLSWLAGNYETGLYNAALPLAGMLLIFITPLKAVLVSITSYFTHKKDVSFVQQTISLLSKFSTVILLPSMLALAAYADFALIKMFGAEYAAAAIVLQILAVAFLFRAIGEVYFSLLAGEGRPEIRTRIIIIGFVVNFVLDAALIPFFGMTGAAIASLAAYGTIYWVGRRYLDHTTIQFKDFFRLVVCIAAFFVTVEVMKRVLSSSFFGALVALVSGGLVYLAAVFLTRTVKVSEIRAIYKGIVGPAQKN